jgi:hypothetical protein
MARPESTALGDARDSAAADLRVATSALRLSWEALGSVLEALELDLALGPEELAMVWAEIARAWREETLGADLTPEAIAEVWRRVADGLTHGTPLTDVLLVSMDAGPLVRMAVEPLRG